jgi:hypothetical protein
MFFVKEMDLSKNNEYQSKTYGHGNNPKPIHTASLKNPCL